MSSAMSKKLRSEAKRKQLDRLRQDYRSVKAQLQALGFVIPGSVVKRTYRCGKSSCRCHQDPAALHGPYYQWSRKVKAKTVGMNLEGGVVATAKEWIHNDRKMRRLIKRLHQISQKMLQVMVELEKMGKEPAPAPAPRTAGKLDEKENHNSGM